MKTLMIVVGFANGASCPIAGQYLESFDHDADEGLGYGTFTLDPAKAMQFDSLTEALEFWQRPSTVNRYRIDGKLNRPLTCTTVTFATVES